MESIIVWRAMERLLIVIFAALAVYLGYRLFWSMREFPADGEGKVELPGGVSIFISRVGPGVFFAMFGVAVLLYSVSRPLAINTPSSADAAPASLSYATEKVQVQLADPEREAIVRDLAILTQMQTALEKMTSAEATPVAVDEATQMLIAMPRIKRTLLAAIWNENQWGPFHDFQRWIESGDPENSPAQLSVPAALYLGGE